MDDHTSSRRLIHNENCKHGCFFDRNLNTASGATFPGTYPTCVAVRLRKYSRFSPFMALAGISYKKAGSRFAAITVRVVLEQAISM